MSRDDIQKLDEDRFNYCEIKKDWIIQLCMENCDGDVQVFLARLPMKTDHRFLFDIKEDDVGKGLKVRNQSYWIQLDDSEVLKEAADKKINNIRYLWKVRLHKLLTGDRFKFSDEEVSNSLGGLERTYIVDEVLHFKQPEEKTVPLLHMNIGNGNADNVFNFVTFWRVGLIKESFEWVKWSDSALKFDRNRFVYLLCGTNDYNNPIEIKHEKKPWRTGRIYLNDDNISFICDKPTSKSEWIKQRSTSMLRTVLNTPKTFYNSVFESKQYENLEETTCASFEEEP